MSDKEKDAVKAVVNPETHEHDCTCDDENCDCNTITLELEDGTEKEFTVLEMIEHEGKSYMALTEGDSEEYDILRVEGDEEELELVIIEDDAEYNAVAEAFDAIFAEEDDEEEDEKA